MKPSYAYSYTLGYYQGGTKYAKGWWTPVCGFGILMAVSRLRDPVIYKKF
jgi:hypothetical protein